MSEKVNRQQLVEYIFDTLDRQKQGHLILPEISKYLPLLNKKNQNVVKKYLSYYTSNNPTDVISKSSFIDLLMYKKKQPVVVHIKLSDLIANSRSFYLPKTFSQRLKQRLDIEKFKTHMEPQTSESNLKDCCKDTNHCEKPRWKSAKQRNLEELLSIRRCHLLYSK